MDLPVEWVHIFSPLLFFISFFGMITSRNVIKTIIFIVIMQTSVIIFWIAVSASHGTTPPIISVEQVNADQLENIADPLPQALMLTAIVIGISVTAIIITMLNTLFRKFSSTDWSTLELLGASSEAFQEKKEEISC